MANEILADVRNLPDRYKRELLRGEHVQAHLDILAQRKLKAAIDEDQQFHIDGIGQKVMCIHPDLLARLRVIYGQSCLHDPDFRKRLLERNPFLRVNCVARHKTVRVNGLKGQRETPANGVQRESATPPQGTETHPNSSGMKQPAFPTGLIGAAA